MTISIHMIITNSGDGSNMAMWTTSDEVLERMEDLADDGNETFASGDGLQVTTFHFSGHEAGDDFIARNRISLTTLEDLEDWE